MTTETYVTRSRGPLDVDVLAGLETLVLHSGADTEGVGAEVVTLGLDEVGGEGLGPVAVEEGQLICQLESSFRANPGERGNSPQWCGPRWGYPRE